jgi:hypothetical protein
VILHPSAHFNLSPNIYALSYFLTYDQIEFNFVKKFGVGSLHVHVSESTTYAMAWEAS